MRQIFGFLKPYIKRMSVGFVIKVIATVAELLIPWAMAIMIDDVVPKGSIPFIFLWGLVMLAFAGISLLCNVTANRMASFVARSTTERIRLQLFSKINYMSMAQQEEVTTASLISRATSDTYNVHQFLGMMQRLGVRQPIMLIGSLVVTFFLDVPLTLVMCAMLPVMALFVYIFCRYGIPMFGKVQKALDRFVTIVREDITGIRVIKALSKTNTERERFEKVNMDVVTRDQMANTVMGGMHPVVNIILNIGMVLVIIYGAKRVDGGATKPGTIMAFMTYVTTILNAVLFMSRMFMMYSRASASGKRIAEILTIEPDLTVREKTQTDEEIRKKAEEGRIIFDHVNFAYGKGENALKNINFALKKGETLGIIGATGSGKTTLVNLMMRYYEVNDGTVYVDGQDVRTFDDETLKTKFGVVFQNDIIFHDTIGENIRFGRPVSDEALELAMKTAQADFIAERGLDYELAIRGANISGGQKQRVFIARALAGNPEILILDDSSSALDYATDARMRGAIRDYYPDTTMVIVAQRISSIMNADKIIVMEEGEMIGYGTHKELMESCEVYREISQSQMGEGGESADSSEETEETVTLTEEQKAEILAAAKEHPVFRDVETYEDILDRVIQKQAEIDKSNMYKECMDTVHSQIKKEEKAIKGVNKKHTLIRLFKYLLNHKLLLLSAILVTILANGIGLITPKLSGQAVDALAGGIGKVDFALVGHYCVLMMITVVVSGVLSYGLNLIMIQVTKRIVSGMRRDMFDRLLNLRVGFFDTHSAGDIISRITYDIDTINTSLSSDVVAIFSSLVTVIGSFVMMMSISPILVLVFCLTIPITVFYTRWLAGITRPLFRARSGKLGELNGFIEEMIGGQKSLKAYHQQINTLNKFQKQNQEAVDAYYRADYMAAFNGPSVNCISNISLGLVTIFGAILYMFGNITIGNISSFVLYSRRFSGPINEAANIMSELQSAIAAAERVFRMLDEPEEMPLSDHEQILSEVKGEVELSHVRFGYTEDREIIHDLSLKAEPGKMIAIVGPTGAGKTTIINLLMRFYDINGGKIFVDGTETREYTRDSLRKAFAMVLQETWLFQGTVYENVAYGKEDATLEDVMEVCQAAHIHKYIMRLPDKYDTVLSDDGTNISKGQKQLLTIARAMLLNAHMLILDEATSNVDTRTEIRIQKAMVKLMKGKTCFIIAHRLSTIRNADLILVVRDGDVVEQGTHDELMAADGFYKQLYEAQWSKGEAL